MSNATPGAEPMTPQTPEEILKQLQEHQLWVQIRQEIRRTIRISVRKAIKKEQENCPARKAAVEEAAPTGTGWLRQALIGLASLGALFGGAYQAVRAQPQQHQMQPALPPQQAPQVPPTQQGGK